MKRQIQVRPARATADNDEIARIVCAVHPDWPLTGTQIAAAGARRGPRLHRKFVVDNAPGRLAGFGFIEVPDVAAVPGRFRVRVDVDPACAERGFGKALYQHLEVEARDLHATELCTEVLEAHPRAARFATDRGFEVYNRRVESRLRLDEVDPGSVARVLDAHTDRMFASGIRIASYRQLALDPEAAPRRLYALQLDLWRDVPFGITGDDPTFEAFLAEELGDPAFRAAGSFVALDGLDWIGLCMQSAAGSHLLTTMTGVVQAWRRNGVATWLKLHSVRYALEAGVAEIRTFNDVANEGMLALNRRLGFTPVSTEVRLKKELR